MHSKNNFPLPVVHRCLHLDVVLRIRRWGASVGGMWTRNLVVSTGAVSAVVWLGCGVEICVVRLSPSLALICPFVWRCSSISVLFFSIGPLYSLGLPHILLVVLQQGVLRPFYSCT